MELNFFFDSYKLRPQLQIIRNSRAMLEIYVGQIVLCETKILYFFHR